MGLGCQEHAQHAYSMPTRSWVGRGLGSGLGLGLGSGLGLGVGVGIRLGLGLGLASLPHLEAPPRAGSEQPPLPVARRACTPTTGPNHTLSALTQRRQAPQAAQELQPRSASLKDPAVRKPEICCSPIQSSSLSPAYLALGCSYISTSSHSCHGAEPFAQCTHAAGRRRRQRRQRWPRASTTASTCCCNEM